MMGRESKHTDPLEELARLRSRVRELESSCCDARRLPCLHAARLRTIINAIPYPIFSKGADLLYDECNQAFAEYLGLPRDAIVGKGVYDVSPPDKAAVYHAADAALLQSGGTQTYETSVRSHDGNDHAVIFHKAVLDDADGSPKGMIGIIVDITDRKRAEQERRQLEEQLWRAQKMESVGQLAGGVAHDFNNLLTAINGYAGLALMDLSPGSLTHQHVQEIMGAAERAARLVQQLLVFSRKQVLRLEVLDLNALLGESTRLLGRLLGENIALRMSLEPNLAPIRADRVHLEQMIMNLALNARDAMPGGGELVLRTVHAPLEERPAGRQPNPTGDPQVMLSVSDTGIGMDAETVSHVFEPFFTTKERGRGTGLGLFVVYGIVQQCGGDIAVRTEPGRGTTFEIRFPSVREQKTDPVPPVEQEPSSTGSETVLVVEDEDAVLRLVASILRSMGYTVLEASKAAQARSLCEQYAAPIDLLLTDVVMPDMSGPELAELVCALRPDMKVLFMTGYAPAGVLPTAAGQFLDYIAKPFSSKILARSVRDALDRKRGAPPPA